MFAPLFFFFFFADTPKWQKNGHKNTQCDGNAGENVVAGSNLKFWDSVLLFHFIIIIFFVFLLFHFFFLVNQSILPLLFPPARS